MRRYASSNGPDPTFRILAPGEKPTAGFVRRRFAVWPEFARRASFFPVQEHEPISDTDQIILWVPRSDHLAYEKNRPLTPRHRWIQHRQVPLTKK